MKDSIKIKKSLVYLYIVKLSTIVNSPTKINIIHLFMMLCTLSFNDHLSLMHVNMCAYASEVTSMYMFIDMLNKSLLFTENYFQYNIYKNKYK